MTTQSTIGICHYRIGKTDGVSLEIYKRKKALERMGYRVKLIAGPRSLGADYVIDELEFDDPRILKIKENAFFKFKDFKSTEEFKAYLFKYANLIKQKFLQIHQKEHFAYLFLHNIFTHGRHIAAAKSFSEVAQETKIQVIAVNHDFHWVGSYKNIYKPQIPWVKQYLKKYVPPKLPQIRHAVINSLNQEALEERIGVKALIFPDTFDFDQKSWVKDNYNLDFLKTIGLTSNDLVVLQATRISARKGIELAIDFVQELTENKDRLVGKTLYNGKKIAADSRIVLVLAGYAEKDSEDYKSKLKERIKQAGIKALFIDEWIDGQRRQVNGQKIYSLWDAYVWADLVTFPSWWEGWGNQFIEAVFAKKPIVIFEYPVFKADIAREGYRVISLGGELTRTKEGLVTLPDSRLTGAVSQAVAWLTEPNTVQVLDHNWKIGKRYHSEAILENLLKKLL